MARLFLFRSWQGLATAVVALGMVTAVPAGSAPAHIVAQINLTDQRMDVFVNGLHYASWRISSGRKGYRTPTGSYRPKFLRRMHYSSKYDNAPMPHSIFFYRGYAIHGTTEVKRLGRPASRGCVRLHPADARELYGLVKRYGMANTRIRISY